MRRIGARAAGVERRTSKPRTRARNRSRSRTRGSAASAPRSPDASPRRAVGFTRRAEDVTRVDGHVLRRMPWNEIEPGTNEVGGHDARVVERRDERPEVTATVEAQREEAARASREQLRRAARRDDRYGLLADAREERRRTALDERDRGRRGELFAAFAGVLGEATSTREAEASHCRALLRTACRNRNRAISRA